MRITVDREACAAAGMCALTAPGHFDQDGRDGRVVLLADEAEDGDAAVEDAARICPTGAIALR